MHCPKIRSGSSLVYNDDTVVDNDRSATEQLGRETYIDRPAWHGSLLLITIWPQLRCEPDSFWTRRPLESTDSIPSPHG